jgi:signal-transduction protein with cAMP-binding, CBS, and nucleotidyltransferase domain
MKQLTENNFTTVGTDQFIMDTRLMMVKVKEAIRGVNPVVSESTSLTDAIIKMTEFGYGAVTVTKADGSIKGVFTDGGLRKLIMDKGRDVLNKKLSDLEYREPISIDGNMLLNEANSLFKKTNVDTIVVTDGGKPVGMLDIQDMKG